LSGDFRANLNPIQVAACDGSAGQQWDIITKGVHDDQAGTMLIVSTLVSSLPPSVVKHTDCIRPRLVRTLTLAEQPETQSSCSLVVEELMAAVL